MRLTVFGTALVALAGIGCAAASAASYEYSATVAHSLTYAGQPITILGNTADVHVRTGDAGTVSVRLEKKANSQKDLDSIRVAVSQEAGTIRIVETEGEIGSGGPTVFGIPVGGYNRRSTSIDLVVTLPKDVSGLTVSVNTGDVTVGALNTSATLKANTGDIHVEGLSGPIEAVTVTGDVMAKDVSDTFSLSSNTGDVTAHLASGWHGKSGLLQTNTGGSSLEAPESLRARVDAKTNTGDRSVSGANFVSVSGAGPLFTLRANTGDVSATKY